MGHCIIIYLSLTNYICIVSLSGYGYCCCRLAICVSLVVVVCNPCNLTCIFGNPINKNMNESTCILVVKHAFNANLHSLGLKYVNLSFSNKNGINSKKRGGSEARDYFPGGMDSACTEAQLISGNYPPASIGKKYVNTHYICWPQNWM